MAYQKWSETLLRQVLPVESYGLLEIELQTVFAIGIASASERKRNGNGRGKTRCKFADAKERIRNARKGV
jgi:hypothetical protein